MVRAHQPTAGLFSSGVSVLPHRLWLMSLCCGSQFGLTISSLALLTIMVPCLLLVALRNNILFANSQ
jgi:hypothetical protein